MTGDDAPTGARGRLGVVWFLVVVGASLLGLVPLAVLFAVVAAVAALQAAARWRIGRSRSLQVLTGAIGASLALAAAFGIALVGAVALVAVVASIVAAVLAAASPGASAGQAGAGRGASRRRARPTVLATAGLVLRCGFFVGIGAAGAVLVARADSTAFIVLLVLVSGFEVGDYLVGSGARSPVEGTVAGMVAVVALTFGLSVFQFGPFDSRAAWVLGGLVAVLAPLGTFLGRALTPAGRPGVPGVLRLDAWLLTAPVWAWVLWGYLG